MLSPFDFLASISVRLMVLVAQLFGALVAETHALTRTMAVTLPGEQNTEIPVLYIAGGVALLAMGV